MIIEKFSNKKAAVQKTETKGNLVSNEKVWVTIGLALLASATIYLQYGGITALLFACALVCLGIVMSKKFWPEVEEMSTPATLFHEPVYTKFNITLKPAPLTYFSPIYFSHTG